MASLKQIINRKDLSEALTHLAFDAGWPNVFSALPVAKDVFEKRPKEDSR
jgi:4-carboxymuconolactone decarboxylase